MKPLLDARVAINAAVAATQNYAARFLDHDPEDGDHVVPGGDDRRQRGERDLGGTGEHDPHDVLLSIGGVAARRGGDATPPQGCGEPACILG